MRNSARILLPCHGRTGVIVWAEVYGEKCCSNLRVLMQTLVPSRVKGKITVLESGECVAEDPGYSAANQCQSDRQARIRGENFRFLLFRNIDNLIIHSTPHSTTLLTPTLNPEVKSQ